MLHQTNHSTLGGNAGSLTHTDREHKRVDSNTSPLNPKEESRPYTQKNSKRTQQLKIEFQSSLNNSIDHTKEDIREETQDLTEAMDSSPPKELLQSMPVNNNLSMPLINDRGAITNVQAKLQVR